MALLMKLISNDILNSMLQIVFWILLRTIINDMLGRGKP